MAPKSLRRRSLSDPLERALLPPPNETPEQRELRERRELEAKKVSDDIDEQLRQEKAALRKKKQEVKILLLGQSESGKSTTLKRGSTLLYESFRSDFWVQRTTRRVCRVEKRRRWALSTAITSLFWL